MQEYKLNPVQLDLLKQGILELRGDVDGHMADYVQECMSRLTAQHCPEITIWIASNGGNVTAGLDVYDLLRVYCGKKTGIVRGYARSMGVIILQACEVRKALRHSRILIHHVSRSDLSLDVLRSPKLLQLEVESMESSQGRINEILRQKTTQTKARIKRECQQNRDMTTDEAMKFGLIDQII